MVAGLRSGDSGVVITLCANGLFAQVRQTSFWYPACPPSIRTSRPRAVYVTDVWSLCPCNARAGPYRMLYAAWLVNDGAQPDRPNT